jgi:polyisoprenoid-binding protein YceI
MSTATATAQAVPAGTWKIDPIHSHVGFAVKHMGVSTFRGQFADYSASLTTGEDGAPRLEGRVDVNSIAVKDENLAGHLKAADFFDTERYPEIHFLSSAIRLGDDGELELEGDLTIKGNTRRVLAHGRVSGPHVDLGGNDRIGVELASTVDRRDFGLEWNAPLPRGGFVLENQVKLEAVLELAREG